jgi:hypothetical protein
LEKPANANSIHACHSCCDSNHPYLVDGDFDCEISRAYQPMPRLQVKSRSPVLAQDDGRVPLDLGGLAVPVRGVSEALFRPEISGVKESPRGSIVFL